MVQNNGNREEMIIIGYRGIFILISDFIICFIL